jgi:hypothetical protein
VATGEHLAPRRIVDVRATGIHEPPRHRRARLTLRGDPDDHDGPQPARVAAAELEGRHRAHREAEQVEGVELERVDEGREVVDEPVVLEAIRRVPPGGAVAAGVREDELEGLREERDLSREVVRPDRCRAMKHDERRPGAVNGVGDVKLVGTERRHDTRV